MDSEALEQSPDNENQSKTENDIETQAETELKLRLRLAHRTQFCTERLTHRNPASEPKKGIEITLSNYPDSDGCQCSFAQKD